MIFINEQNRKEDMKIYHAQHQLEVYENYNYNIQESTKSDIELAKYINKNLYKMENEEMSLLINKCLSFNQKKKFLLEYELKHYKEIPQDMSLKEFIKKASDILKRYTWKAGGFLLEDRLWIVQDKSSDEFMIEDNEVIFLNSIEKQDLDNTETKLFLHRIIDRLNCLCSNIKVKQQHRLFNTTIWILLHATYNTEITEDKAVIDL